MAEAKRRPTLFARTLRSFLASLAVLLVLLTGAVVLGVGWSAQGWTRDRSTETGLYLESLVLASYRARGGLDKEAIAVSTLPHLDSSSYLYVFDTTDTLVFAWRLGERVDDRSGAEPGAGRNFLARHADSVVRRELADRDVVIGSIAAGVLSFTEDTANRRFLVTLAAVGGVGAGLSFLFALAISWKFSGRIAGQAARLAAGLVRLASGEREVRFDTDGPRELADIGRSSELLQGRLTQEERVRRQWAADVAHDLRTPVAAMKAQIEAMSDGVLPVTPQRLGQAAGELGKIEALVNDLGELARIESPDLHPRLVPVEATTLAEDLCRRFEAEARSRGLALVLAAEPGLILRADPHLLDRALVNLVRNAIDHADSTGAVEIGIRRTAGEPPAALISVKNPGSVSADDLGRVFDRLYRGERAHRTGGSGLGLSITRAIAEVHGGTIAMTTPGRGTVLVELRLPL